MNLLIVDDEKQIREGMKKYITKKNFRFSHISIAKDGTEALQISTQIKPDLLITDISMPMMDGIELATRMKVLFPDIKIVLITGFKEIDLMKRAFKLSVIDYLLKPIDVNELNPVLEKIVSNYEIEIEEKAEMTSLKGNWSENIAVLRGTYLASLLVGRMKNPESITSQLKSVQIGLDIMRPMVVINILFNSNEILVRESSLSVVMDTIEDTLRPAGKCTLFQKSGTEIVGIVNPNNSFTDGGQDSLHNRCCTLLDRLISSYGEGITIGMGCFADNYLTLPDSYTESHEAVNQRFIVGNGHVIVIPKSRTKDPLTFVPERALVEDIILYIQAGEQHKVEEFIHLILKPLYRRDFMSLKEIETVRLELVSMTKQIIGKITHKLTKQYDLGELLTVSTLDELGRNIVVLLSSLCEHYKQHGKKKSALIISKVMEWN